MGIMAYPPNVMKALGGGLRPAVELNRMKKKKNKPLRSIFLLEKKKQCISYLPKMLLFLFREEKKKN